MDAQHGIIPGQNIKKWLNLLNLDGQNGKNNISEERKCGLNIVNFAFSFSYCQMFQSDANHDKICHKQIICS